MPAIRIHVHLERPSPRAHYAVRTMLEGMLGWKVSWVDNAHELATAEGPRLCYGPKGVEGALHIVPAGLLNDEGVRKLEPELIELEGLPMIFPVQGGHLPFDPFSAAFFHLTRYEELSGFPCDALGRPLAGSMHAYRHSYLQRPVVDEWALLLARTWLLLDPSVPAPQRSYGLVNTIDLDNGFKYLGRPLWRSLGSMARDVFRGAWSELPARIMVLAGLRSDPFDIYEELRPHLSEGAARTVFFVLTAPRGPMDHAVPVEYKAYSQRLRSLATWAEVGLHPSYISSEEAQLTAKEKERLSSVLGKPVILSRQHFLRFKLPGSYRELEKLGMGEEHSMGTHEQLGFRAGTCTPYPWFDVLKDRPTELIVHPFAVMDNTLRHKLHLTPEQAVAAAAELIRQVRSVNGTFIGLWHESFLSHSAEDAPWRKAILQIIQMARP